MRRACRPGVSSCSSPVKRHRQDRVLDAFLGPRRGRSGFVIARGACLEHYGAAEAYLPVLDAFGRLLREPEASGDPCPRDPRPDMAGTAAVVGTNGGSRDVAPAVARVTKGNGCCGRWTEASRRCPPRPRSLSAEISTGATIRRSICWGCSAATGTGALARGRSFARWMSSWRPPATGAHPGAAVRRQCEDIALPFLREPHVAALSAQRFGGHAFSPSSLAPAPADGTEIRSSWCGWWTSLVALRVLEAETGAGALSEAARRDRSRGTESSASDREADRAPGAGGATPARAASVLGVSSRWRPSRPACQGCGWRSKSAATNWHDRGSSWPRQSLFTRPTDAGGPLPLHPQSVSKRPD